MRITTLRANFRLFLLFTLVGFTYPSDFLFAQAKEKKAKKKPTPKHIIHQKWEVGGMAGISQYQGDLQNFDAKELNLANGLFARYHFNDNFAIRGGFTYGTFSGNDSNYPDDTGRKGRLFTYKSPARELAVLGEYDILGKKRYTNLDKGKFNRVASPYLFAGVGFLSINPNVNFNEGKTSANINNIKADRAIKEKKGNLAVPVGIGIKMDISKYWALGIEAGLRLTFNDYIDGVSKAANPKNDDTYLMGGLTLSYRIPHVKDTDGDGIADETDACPEIAGPLKSKGCPDSDKDGTGDQFDKCPDIAGLRSLNGCPDTDRDGVPDGEDDCPDLVGLKDLKGCPDTDEDGIADKLDECPTEKGVLDYNGCPIKDTDEDGIEDKLDQCPKQKGSIADKGCPPNDSDKDGVPDREDVCPDKKGEPRFKGCPDTDADGIADNIDKCPDAAGTNLENGCPEIKKEDKELLKQAIYGVEFEIGKSIIRPKSYVILDNVVSVLNKYPEYTIMISGHTDKVGKEATNLRLSKARAKACHDYFASKGINIKRMSYEGVGSAVPVADNKTAIGRAKNRRVEFSLFMK